MHRIGRTARAGASGISVSFADEQEAFSLMDIEEYIDAKLPCVRPPEELLNILPALKKENRPQNKTGRRNSARRYRGSKNSATKNA